MIVGELKAKPKLPSELDLDLLDKPKRKRGFLSKADKEEYA